MSDSYSNRTDSSTVSDGRFCSPSRSNDRIGLTRLVADEKRLLAGFDDGRRRVKLRAVHARPIRSALGQDILQYIICERLEKAKQKKQNREPNSSGADVQGSQVLQRHTSGRPWGSCCCRGKQPWRVPYGSIFPPSKTSSDRDRIKDCNCRSILLMYWHGAHLMT